jgi:glucokinase
MFVSAYGAEAGNLALRGLALGGVYVGGGIAPKIPAGNPERRIHAGIPRQGTDDRLLTKVPVKVILNAESGLIGAATRANELSR